MLLTVSVPDDFRLVVFNGGVNDHSAAQTQSLALGAEGHLEFVNDGCLEGNTVLGAKTVCRGGQKETRQRKWSFTQSTIILFLSSSCYELQYSLLPV